MSTNYPPEILHKDEDDGTMVESREALEQAIVGHRIVSAERIEYPKRGYGYGAPDLILTLDNGKRVKMLGQSDCCAWTGVEKFMVDPTKVDHVITGVGTTEGYTKWHIFADLGDILTLDVEWSCGNPFYYAYGFDIQVVDA